MRREGDRRDPRSHTIDRVPEPVFRSRREWPHHMRPPCSRSQNYFSPRTTHRLLWRQALVSDRNLVAIVTPSLPRPGAISGAKGGDEAMTKHTTGTREQWRAA